MTIICSVVQVTLQSLSGHSGGSKYRVVDPLKEKGSERKGVRSAL